MRGGRKMRWLWGVMVRSECCRDSDQLFKGISKLVGYRCKSLPSLGARKSQAVPKNDRQLAQWYLGFAPHDNSSQRSVLQFCSSLFPSKRH